MGTTPTSDDCSQARKRRPSTPDSVSRSSTGNRTPLDEASKTGKDRLNGDGDSPKDDNDAIDDIGDGMDLVCKLQ